MPELPEVETIKRDLATKIVGREIIDFKLLSVGTLKGIEVQNFKKIVRHQRITAVERRAKNLIIRLSGGKSLLMHMKMTGHLLVEPDTKIVDEQGHWVSKEGSLKDPINQYVRAIFWLNDGIILAFSDLRKFGYIKLVEEAELQDFLNSYGPEPFSPSFNQKYLEELFSRKKQAIKKVIMDQKNIAGIGNIYADEILWAINVHPEVPANSLDKKQISEFLNATLKILSKAIELRGTSTSDYRDTEGLKGSFESQLMAYRRTGLPCARCKTEIKKIVVGGRGTHFCPKCQKGNII